MPEKNVVLLDVFDWNPFIYCSAYLSNYLAESTNSEIHTFNLAEGWSNFLGIPFRRLNRIYASFGGKLKLRKNWKSAFPHIFKARAMAKTLRKQVKTKADLVNLKIGEYQVGHLIYDAYLRRLSLPTLNLDDPRLENFIYQACLTSMICETYLNRHKVKAIISTHFDYIEYGILTVVASHRKIPIFVFHHDSKFILSEVGVHNKFQRRIFWDYKKRFSLLTAEEKGKAKEAARSVLEDRLKGKPDVGVMYLLKEGTPGINGYSNISDSVVLKKSNKPKVLVLLHCFFDSPHVYRDMLFPDIWEWLNFILTKAKDSPYEWYVKPHPQGRIENDGIVADFERRFPEVNFLGRKISNKQIVDEGIKALFTIYGTAAHEFAYMGVPVVNAGDNPHMGYGFNFHPKNQDELEKLVRTAGELSLPIQKDEILEFFYMHYLDSFRENRFQGRCIDHEDSYETIGWSVTDSKTLEKFALHDSLDKKARIYQYLDEYMSAFDLGRKKSSNSNPPVIKSMVEGTATP